MTFELSIDLEEWFHAELVRKYNPIRQKQAVQATAPILDLLERKRAKATFFVLGEVAEAQPDLIREIHSHGHEIASHGFSHKRLHELNPSSFARELELTEQALFKAVGIRPKGFRAATFSLDQSTAWALQVLTERGYDYDSSLFPGSTPLYGVKNAHKSLHFANQSNLTTPKERGNLVEAPMSVASFFGMQLPVGGFELRFLPYWLSKKALENSERQTGFAIVYLHPWETYAKTPRQLKMNPIDATVTYYGIETGLEKLNKLLDDFEFTSTLTETTRRFKKNQING
ncbi:hypothetical protein AUJ65_02205 [Candidatus Micrarchaeota archaeon CG1_02_51_15]|nr:MAG: hypothetical protein AUJ65_02205 [Candidatus Micrarchaeota archaeon CG1_02_51_15]